MKVEIIDDNKIIVFLNKNNTADIDLNNKSSLEVYFKQVFLKLKNTYNLYLSGYCNVDLYIDQQYGMIMEIEQEDSDYYTYYQNQVDMKINIAEQTNFLYEINDIFDDNIISRGKIYIGGTNIYFKLEEELDKITMGKLMENSKIVYGEKVASIIKYSKEVQV